MSTEVMRKMMVRLVPPAKPEPLALERRTIFPVQKKIVADEGVSAP